MRSPARDRLPATAGRKPASSNNPLAGRAALASGAAARPRRTIPFSQSRPYAKGWAGSGPNRRPRVYAPSWTERCAALRKRGSSGSAASTHRTPVGRRTVPGIRSSRTADSPRSPGLGPPAAKKFRIGPPRRKTAHNQTGVSRPRLVSPPATSPKPKRKRTASEPNGKASATNRSRSRRSGTAIAPQAAVLVVASAGCPAPGWTATCSARARFQQSIKDEPQLALPDPRRLVRTGFRAPRPHLRETPAAAEFARPGDGYPGPQHLSVRIPCSPRGKTGTGDRSGEHSAHARRNGGDTSRPGLRNGTALMADRAAKSLAMLQPGRRDPAWPAADQRPRGWRSSGKR
ncbi:hypothetical protein A4R44_07311 [Amycolatopsis sp. M39]|nr:hypothetical protein A4R44_07311 [Amycolatopsis sp. M39]